MAWKRRTKRVSTRVPVTKIAQYPIWERHKDYSGISQINIPFDDVQERLEFALAARRKYPKGPIDIIEGVYPVIMESYPIELKEWLEEYGRSISKFRREYDFSPANIAKGIAFSYYTDYDWKTGEILRDREGELRMPPNAIEDINSLLNRKNPELRQKLNRYFTGVHPPLQFEPWKMVIEISTHPNDIMTKSTGTQWVSCETVGHMYGGL